MVPSAGEIVGTEIKEEQRWFQDRRELLELKSRKALDSSNYEQEPWN